MTKTFCSDRAVNLNPLLRVLFLAFSPLCALSKLWRLICPTLRFVYTINLRLLTQLLNYVGDYEDHSSFDFISTVLI